MLKFRILADLIYQFDTCKRELIKSWPARGDGAADMALDQTQHRLFVGTRIPPEMTVYAPPLRLSVLRTVSGSGAKIPKL